MHKLTLLLTFVSCNSMAQIAMPSIFAEVRSINPALIYFRKLNATKVEALNDSIQKEQNITTLNGSVFVAKETSDIHYTDVNFFRGGKGGGAYTTEFTIDTCSGKRTTTLLDSNSSKVVFETDTKSNYVNFAVGSAQLGFDIHYVQFHSDYTFKQSVNNTNFDDRVTLNMGIMGFKTGVVFGSAKASLGITGEYDKLQSDLTSVTGLATTNSSSDMKYVGLAAAVGSTDFLLEFAIEADPFTDQKTDVISKSKPPMPMKISTLIEGKFGFITAGYKTMTYSGQYIELDKLIPYQLVYTNPEATTRTEHSLNLLFGPAGGWSFGGSASYTDLTKKERSAIFYSSESYDTHITETAISAKISYVF